MCWGFFMVIMFKIFLEYLHLIPPKQKSQEKNYIFKIIGSKFQLSVNPIYCIN